MRESRGGKPKGAMKVKAGLAPAQVGSLVSGRGRTTGPSRSSG